MIRLVSTWVLVNGMLMASSWVWPTANGAPVRGWLSLEAALLVGGMALLPRRPWSRALARFSAAGVILFVIVSLADVILRASLGRPLNLSLDLYLLDAVYRLAVGNSGWLRTVLGGGAIAIGFGLASLVTAWRLVPNNPDGEQPRQPRVRRFAGGIVIGALALGLIGLVSPAVGDRLHAPALRLVVEQAELRRVTRAERATFAAELERQPDGFTDLPGLLSSLAGHNVVIAFIESYGMAALEDPEFASVVRPRLETSAVRLASAGLHIASGELTSPTLGGQSWYAHGTVISGLWLENQLRYDLLIASDREILVDDFSRAGYRTAAVMPAITTSWPEGIRLGYDDIYTAPTIPYAGPPFYWVTMPDQYTWSFVGEIVRNQEGPIFVEAAMVSSHAPWTPILPLVEWDSIGDGTAFEPHRRDGHPPEELWWDVAALREGYAASIEYSLHAMADFAERYLDERTLLVVLGDHQAAPWVTGASDGDVPVHVITHDAALLEPFLEWGFTPGMLPNPEGSPARMDEFREWFVRAFSGGADDSTTHEEKPGN